MQAAASRATIERFERVLGESIAGSAIGRLADLDFQTYLTDDINVKVDIASMAHALEVRCPYLDTDVVEFAARLPASMLMRIRGKYLLRRAAAEPRSRTHPASPEARLRAAAETLAAPRSQPDDARRAARSHGAGARAVRSCLRCEARRLAGSRVRSGGPDLDAAHARALVSRVHRCAALAFARAATVLNPRLARNGAALPIR